jgi:hypothetical protein
LEQLALPLGRHTDDRVHGRAYFMGHIRETTARSASQFNRLHLLFMQ